MFRKRATGLFSLAESLLDKLSLKPSTRELWRANRKAGASWWQFVHGYVSARWPYGYIGSAIGERVRVGLRLLRVVFAPFLAKALSPRRWADGYHGKVILTGKASRLVRIQEEVQSTVPERVIPFENARDLILSRRDHICAL